MELKDFIKKENLLCDGDRVLLGVSGGADSVCLLFSFLDLKKEYDITPYVLYVEHGVRGEDSVKDGRFVEDLCRRLSVDHTMVSVDAPSYAEKNHMSLEEAARMLRYDAFYETALKKGCNKIATAHNANDNAETILFRMIRGTGLKGLSGIPPKRRMEDMEVIRPLLCVTRQEIEEDLKSRGESYVTDATNEADDYSRNRLRHRVLPVLEEINAGAINHINEAGRRIGEMYARDVAGSGVTATEEFVTGDGAKTLGKTENGAPEPLLLKDLQEMPEEIRKETILNWLRAQNAAHDVGSVHIEMMGELIFMGVGKEYHLPHGYYVKNDYEYLRLYRKPSSEPEMTDARGTAPEHRPGREPDRNTDRKEDPIPIPPLSPGENYRISMPGLDLRFLLSDDAPTGAFEQKAYAKTFDYGKIMGSLELRHRREGDYIVIHPDGRKKKLQDYLVEQKIPREERNDLWLLCSGAKVLWVIGHRNSEDARVDETTKQCLTVEYWRS